MSERIALVPLKSFATAKQRLRTHLSDQKTAALVEQLAKGVLMACRPLTTWIVTDDADVEQFAAGLGLQVFRPSRPGLNEGVVEAYHRASHDFECVVIAHADIAEPTGLGSYDYGEGITLFTDHTGLGSNVLSLPTGLDFTFHYGVDSASCHIAESHRLGIKSRVIRDSPWRFDIDCPEDLSGPQT
jgi:2-phospho-L-lactate/phosphoenolpyruvate guanylyltransferase